MPSTRSTARKTAAKGVFTMFGACPRCHRPLKRITVELFGRKTEVTCYGSCGCEESRWDGLDVNREDRRLVVAGIDPKYLRFRADSSELVSNLSRGASAYVHGPNGTGKSTLAANAAKGLLESGRTVLMRNSKRLVEEIKQTYDGRDTSILERCYGVDVLVLDDVGKEYATEYALSMLYAVIETRYAEMRPVLVTSNFGRDELVARWAAVDAPTAEAIVSRLCDGVAAIEMGGDDRRCA